MASNEFADFLPRWDDTWLLFSRFSSSVTTPAENQRPTATNVSDSFPPPFPFPIALPFYVLIWYQFCNAWNYRRGKEVQKNFRRGNFLNFLLRYSILLHLPPLRFHCVGGCWDRTLDCYDFGHWQIDALSTWLDLIRSRLDLIPKNFCVVIFTVPRVNSTVLLTFIALFFPPVSYVFTEVP